MVISAHPQEAIRNLLARYNWCGDNGDYEGFLDCFTEDGVLDLKGIAIYRGRDEIRVGLDSGFGAGAEHRERLRLIGRLAHHVSSVRIEMQSPAEARTWSYFAVVGASGWDHWGRYTDQLVCIEGHWLLTYRRVSIDGRAG